jgi:hypothetical protein
MDPFPEDAITRFTCLKGDNGTWTVIAFVPKENGGLEEFARVPNLDVSPINGIARIQGYPEPLV